MHVQVENEVKIHIGQNAKFGVGYQARMVERETRMTVDGVAVKKATPRNEQALLMLIDEKPFTLAEIVAEARKALDSYNVIHETAFEFREVAWVAYAAIEANAERDPMSAELYKKVKLDAGRVIDIPDSAESDILLTGVQSVELMYSTWKEDGDEVAHRFVSRYCKYIAAHGYEDGAENAEATLKSLPTPDGRVWIRGTYADFVKDDADAMSFIVGKAKSAE